MLDEHNRNGKIANAIRIENKTYCLSVIDQLCNSTVGLCEQ